jgi:hypothetical protein
MTDFFTPSRREFLALAGAGAVTSASAGAGAGPQMDTRFFDDASRAAVLVHDPDLPVPPALAARLEADGGLVVPLAGDPVRLWRDGLAARVESAGALYGYTLWADLLIFQGLARELRRHLQAQKLDAATGRIAWRIA